MNKYLFLILPVLIAGCTVNELESGFNDLVNNAGDDFSQDHRGYSFSINESRVFTSLNDLSFLDSAYPAPLEANFPVNNSILLIFNEWGGYGDFSFSLYEKESLSHVWLDISTYDSFDSTDLGLIPSDDLGIASLKPNTEYVLLMTNVSGDYSEYYYMFTTGDADLTKPTVEEFKFENDDLSILFSKPIKSWSLKEAGNFVLKKDDVALSANFENLRTSASYGWQNVRYFIEYSDLVPGTYELIIKNLEDVSGNIIEDYSTAVIKE